MTVDFYELIIGVTSILFIDFYLIEEVSMFDFYFTLMNSDLFLDVTTRITIKFYYICIMNFLIPFTNTKLYFLHFKISDVLILCTNIKDFKIKKIFYLP